MIFEDSWGQLAQLVIVGDSWRCGRQLEITDSVDDSWRWLAQLVVFEYSWKYPVIISAVGDI